jgi:hypothetical protein
MNDEPRHQPGVPAFRQIGAGHLVTRSCMGCNTNRLTIGGKGIGIRWRCAGCITTRRTAAQP